MKNRGHHLQDERLYDCYLTARGGDPLDPPVADHLSDCAVCADRYAELMQLMEVLSVEAATEADGIYTSDRLRTQRQQIARRIEHLGHPARVITFPVRSVGPYLGTSAPRPGRRWIAAAAAAGLFVGVGTGFFFDWERAPGRRATSGVIARQTVLTAPAGRAEGRIDALAGGRMERVGGVEEEVVRPNASEDDRAFLSELELAGERPRIRELSAVDALTPHVREINLR